jgi:hypothetical protein
MRNRKERKPKKIPAISVLGPVLDSQVASKQKTSLHKRDGSLNTSYNISIFSKKFHKIDDFF